ncbi:MAG: TonB family protein [Bacteroidota bacterium]
MKNLLLALFALGILSSTAFAQIEKQEDKTLSPYFMVKSDDKSVEQLPLLSTTAEVHIAGVIAAVTVRQTYKNSGKKPIEAIYVFPSSTRAAVYAMTMYIGPRVLKAEIQKKEEARKTYEKAKSEGKSASLLEQERPNVFTMSVANIMPGDTIVVEMKYTELLIPTDGVYEFVYPTVVGPRYSNKNSDSADKNDKFIESPYQKEGEAPTYKYDIALYLSTGVPLDEITCPSHNVDINKTSETQAQIRLLASDQTRGNKDFILKYRLTGGKIESGMLLSKSEKENYFLLMLQPPKRVEAKQIPPREFIFILDVSGSMNGFPLERSKELMKNILNSLKPNEKFNIQLFAGSSVFFAEKSVEATDKNIQKAMDFVNKQQGGGGTELIPALKQVLAVPKEDGYSRTIAIMTDGYVAVEEETFNLIRENLNKANMFAFGIGTSVNRFLIEGIAKAGMGESFVVTKDSEAKDAAERFRKYVESPVMTDIKIEYDGFLAFDVEPLTIPDVLANRPIIIYGKWMGEPTGNVIVTGTSGDVRYNVNINVLKFGTMEQSEALKYLWARNKISMLSDYYSASHKKSYVEEITDLGLRYNLLTNYTSFVAVDYEVRNGNADSLVKVKQPLPLPEGVSNLAVGTEEYSMQQGMGGMSSSSPLMVVPSNGKKSMSKEYVRGGGKVKTDSKASDGTVRISDEGEIYTYTEKPAKLDSADFAANLTYPEAAYLGLIQGQVLVHALIDKEGKVKNTQLERTDHELLSKWAVEAINKSKFTPAENKNKKVECWVTVPVSYKLKDKSAIADNSFKRMPSGLKFKDVKKANLTNTDMAVKGKKVQITYKVFLPDGTLVEEIKESGRPFEFVIGQHTVLAALEQGVNGMKAGDARFLEVPANLGYGNKGLEGKVPPDSKLYIYVELLAVS